MRRLFVMCAAAVAALVFGAGSCGSSQKINSSPVATGAHKGPAGTKARAAAVAHVGSTLAVADQTGSKANVTLLKMIDPAQGADQFTTPDAGKRFVGAQFQIAAVGSKAFSGDILNDASAVGSDNQTYTADLNSIAGCTDFADGSYNLAPGQTSTGCATFQIPAAVKVVQVNFAPSSGFGGTAGEWKVP